MKIEMDNRIKRDISFKESLKQYYNLRGLVSEDDLLQIVDEKFNQEIIQKAELQINKELIKREKK